MDDRANSEPGADSAPILAALRDGERRLAALFEQSPVSIQIFAPDGRAIAANPAWERMWGASTAEMAGYNILQDEQLRRIGIMPIVEAAFKGEPQRVPPVAYDPAEIGRPGRARWVETRIYPVKDANQKIQEVVLLHEDVTERVEADERASRSRIRYEALVKASAQVVWSTSAEGRVVEDLPTWRAFTGQTFEQMKDFGWLSAVHPEDQARTQAVWEKSLATVTPHEQCFRVLHATGQYRWVRGRAVPIKNEDGGVREWIGTCVDETEERSREALLHGQREALELIAGGAPLVDVFTLLCRTAEAISGADAKCSIMLLEDNRLRHGGGPSLPESYIAAIDGIEIGPNIGTCASAAYIGERVITPSIASSPTWAGLAHLPLGIGLRSAWSMPIFSSEGKVLGTFGSYYSDERPPAADDLENIEVLARTASLAIERYRAERELRDGKAALETVNRIGQSLSRQLDLRRLTQSLTEAATELTGAQFGAFFYNVFSETGESLMLYTLSGAPREAFAKFPNPRKTAIFAPTFNGEAVVRINDVRVDDRYAKNPPYKGMPEGHLPVVSYLAVPVVSQTGEVIGGLIFGHEDAGVFTEQHEKILLGIASQAAIAMDNARLYEQLNVLNSELERRVEERTAELLAANRELEGFTYSISHDLRSPLRAINATSNILLEELGSDIDEGRRQQLVRQAENAKKVAQIIDDLLKLSRLSRYEVARQPIDVSALADEVAEDARIAGAKVVIQPGLTAMADANLLRLTLQNLFENAVKFAKPGVKPSIWFGQEDEAFFIRDDGIGFDMKYAENVFRAFERLHRENEYPGTGIGLANVKRAVERHGGHTWAVTEPGKGATFYFTLEGQQKEPTATEPSASK